MNVTVGAAAVYGIVMALEAVMVYVTIVNLVRVLMFGVLAGVTYIVAYLWHSVSRYDVPRDYPAPRQPRQDRTNNVVTNVFVKGGGNNVTTNIHVEN